MSQSRSLWTWLSLTARVLALGATLPLVVARFAAPDVAIWYLFATIMALQLIADMGLSPVFARFYSYALGGAAHVGSHAKTQVGAPLASDETDWAFVARIFGTTRMAYRYVSASWLIVVVAGGGWAVADLVAASADPDAAWLACAVVAIGTTVRLHGNVYTSFLFGMDRIIAWRRMEAMTWLASAVAGVATLVAGGGILALTLVTQGFLSLNVVINARLVQRMLAAGGAGAVGERPDRAIWAEVWPRALRGGLGVTMHAGILHLATLAVARLESPAVAGGYLIAYNVIRAVDQFAQAPFYTKLPALAACRVRGEAGRLVELARRGMRDTYWVLALALIAAGIVLPWLLDLVGSSVRFVRPEIWVVMAAAVFVERYGANHVQLYMTTNHVVLHVANGLTGLLFVVFAVAGYRALGLMAIPLAQLAANLVWFAGYGARRSYGSIDVGIWEFERSTSLVPALLILAYAGLVYVVK